MRQHRTDSLTEERPSSLLRIHPAHPIVEVSKTGLMFSAKTSLDSWEAIGQQILHVAASATWWMADWVAYGESAFKDRYVEAIRKTDLDYQTLRNYSWVTRRFEHSRRHEALSFGHHAEVAALGVPEQDYWLRKAEEHSWSRNHLRSELRASLRERQVEENRTEASTESSKEQAAEMLRLRITHEQLARFTAAADVRSLRLAEWIIEALEAVAHKEAGGIEGTRAVPPAGQPEC
jgi:hypothetical protein